MMKKNNKGGFFLLTPFFVALSAAHFKLLWLVPATVILIFIMVAVLPFCHKRENLWLFVLWAVCSVPVNLFLLTEFPQWRYVVYSGSGKGILYYAALAETALICTGVEEVIIALVGRRLWKRQYVLYIPEEEEW